MVNGNYLGMTEGKTAALVYIITVGFKKKKNLTKVMMQCLTKAQ